MSFPVQVERLTAEVAEAASSAQEFAGEWLTVSQDENIWIANNEQGRWEYLITWLGKAERREAEVAKLQRTVVNRGGQVDS